MHNALKAKLIKRLRNVLGVNSGRLAVDGLKAVLIDIRDLLAVTKEDSRYKVLKFHCDWILHPQMTGPRGRKIIKAVDDECIRSVNRAGLQDWPDDVGPTFFGPLSQEFMNEVQNRFTFYELEAELRGFLERWDIVRIADPTAHTWRQFEVLYCKLIGDRTWDYTSKKEPVRYVNRLRVHMTSSSNAPDASPDLEAFPYLLVWQFFWNDEQRLMFTVEFLRKPTKPRTH
jgi:hypothetical protein